jgi:hypothetical protein
VSKKTGGRGKKKCISLGEGGGVPGSVVKVGNGKGIKIKG